MAPRLQGMLSLKEKAGARIYSGLFAFCAYMGRKATLSSWRNTGYQYWHTTINYKRESLQKSSYIRSFANQEITNFKRNDSRRIEDCKKENL
ncbi:hypothetical protein TNCT_606871 [Trichonephila clavata]|uniref:Uncharacterized protein n=1 Tax=Trichonephila clavata TaxID=2740835 RepID=A0A8X6LEJ6_TRICU|nr:hypothetical protein TNCT_606871 [Trichonephila clavata]